MVANDWVDRRKDIVTLQTSIELRYLFFLIIDLGLNQMQTDKVQVQNDICQEKLRNEHVQNRIYYWYI